NHDFTKDVDPRTIKIFHPGLHGTRAEVKRGHVYLERILDDKGNNFYVMLKVIHLDNDGRFVAFLWRRFPGGKVVVSQEEKQVWSPEGCSAGLKEWAYA